MPVDGGDETKILDAVPARSFTVVEKGIYFTSRWEQGRFAIQFFEFASRQTRPVVVSERPVGGVTVSPDGRSILYNQVDQQGSDLMLVENFR